MTRRLDRVALLCLIPAALLAVAGWLGRWVNEDGYIYLRIADNVLAGNGPVFNAGERVEAYTGPLWLAILSVTGGLARSVVSLEHQAVILGLLFSVGGLAAATLAGLRLARARGGAGRVAPLGALVVAALPPFWDYATSGLETGLVVAWMGTTFLALTRWALPGGTPRRAWLTALLIGLGPLVRPDLAIFSAAFGLALVLLARVGVGGALRLALAAVALPLAYQVFRMGYFASLLPNTALAKEAGSAFWSRGAAYLANTLFPYALWLPLLALLGLLGLQLRGVRERSVLVPAVAPVAAALLHALYVVRLGGDYMHARMLLPSVLGLLLPVAVVPLPRGRWAAVAPVVIVAGWALVCAIGLRAPSSPASPPGDQRFLDQHRKRTPPPGHSNFVTLADYNPVPYSQPYVGRALRALSQGGRGALVVAFVRRDVVIEGHRFPVRAPQAIPGVRPRPPRQHQVVAYTGSIGRVGYAAGDGVRIVDRLGLADPIGARLRLTGRRHGLAGHEKSLPVPWFLARYAPAAPRRDGARGLASERQVAAARRALACPPLRDVIAGVSRPLSAGRFLKNIGVAWRERSLRVAPDPVEAERELCRPG